MYEQIWSNCGQSNICFIKICILGCQLHRFQFCVRVYDNDSDSGQLMNCLFSEFFIAALKKICLILDESENSESIKFPVNSC